MAERIEEPEAATEQALDQASPAAVALALGRTTKGGETLDAEATTFLREQTDLIRLQKEHLHEQRELQTSRLRLGRWKDRISLTLQSMTVVAGLAIALALAAMAWRAHEDHGLRIEAFSVAPDIAQKGLTGQVIASQLLDKLAALQAKTVTGRPASSYADDWGGDIKVEIPETGVSVGELSRYLREWLGSETRISGEVVHTAAGLAITARAGANAGATFQGAETDIDKLTQQAAEAVYAQTQPYRYAVYLASSGQKAQAMAAFGRLASTGAPEDRAWAYAGRAAVLWRDGDGPQALEAARRALAIDDGLQPARITQSASLIQLGRLEEAAKVSRRVMTDMRARRGDGLTDAEMDQMAQISTGEEAIMRADYPTAIALLTQGPITMEGQAYDIRGDAAGALALNHDIAGARRIVGLMGMKGPFFLDFLALEDWGAFVPYLGTIPVMDPVRRSREVAYIAMVYAHLGRLAEAEAMLARTPEDSFWGLDGRGVVAAQARDWPAADRWFAEAARLTPSIPTANTDWGRALLDKGDVDGAIAKFAKAHRITPHFADPIELWGEALARKGDLAGAASKFAEADKDAPRWGRNHMAWGEALMLAGRHAEARRQYETANGLELSQPDRAALNVLLARTASGPLHG